MGRLDAVADSVGSMIPLANAALTEPGDAGFDDFASVVSELSEFREEVVALTELRPLRAFRPLLRPIGDCLYEAAQSLLEALASSNIGELQHHGARIQPAIDSATDAVAEVSELISAWRELLYSGDAMAGLVQLASRQAGKQNLVGFAHFGNQKVDHHFPGVSLDPSVGVLGALVSVQAWALMDEAQFWDVAQAAFSLITDRPQSASDLSKDPTWANSWERSIAEAYWSAERLTMLFDRAEHSDDTVRTTLEACHDTQEGLAKTVFGTLRFASNPNLTFSEVTASGPHGLFDWALARGLDISEAVRLPSRNAYAHKDWVVEENRITLCRIKPPMGGPVTVDERQLEDHALALGEVTLGAFLGVTLALIQIGVEIPVPTALIERSARPLAAAMLAAAGWGDIEFLDAPVSEAADSVAITATLGRPGELSDLAAISSFFPWASTLTIHASTANGRSEVHVDLERLRAWSDEEEPTCKQLAFIEALHHTTIDGKPVAPTEEVRRVVAATVSRLATEHELGAGAKTVFLRARAVARSCHDHELEGLVRLTQGWRTSIIAGRNRSAEELSDLVAWSNASPAMSIEF